jgi:hypothetical protein
MVEIGEEEARLRKEDQGTKSDDASGTERSDARTEAQAA